VKIYIGDIRKSVEKIQNLVKIGKRYGTFYMKT